jgi:hypothetical protein
VDLGSKDLRVKTEACGKLLFLLNESTSLGGEDCNWAIFPVIELMGSGKFECKRIAYVVAPLVIKPGDPLMNLLPNIFRKDLK